MLSAYVIFPPWLVFLQSLATFSIPPDLVKAEQPVNVEKVPTFRICLTSPQARKLSERESRVLNLNVSPL